MALPSLRSASKHAALFLALAVCWGCPSSAREGDFAFARIAVKITDPQGQPVAGASVQLTHGQDRHQAETDADGNASVRAASEGTATVRVVAQGFVSHVDAVESNTETLQWTLHPSGTTREVVVGVAATIVDRGARVELPADGLDAAPSSKVDVSMTFMSHGGSQTPSALRAAAVSSEGTLQGHEVVAVVARDRAGRPIPLSPGASATLTLPPSLALAPRSEVPLWYRSETTGTWLRSGVAKVDSTGALRADLSRLGTWAIGVATPGGAR